MLKQSAYPRFWPGSTQFWELFYTSIYSNIFNKFKGMNLCWNVILPDPRVAYQGPQGPAFI